MKIVLQIFIIVLFYAIGDIIAHCLPIPLPGSVIGLALLLLALHLGWINGSALRDGAKSLLNRMLLFFVPAVPSVINHPEFATSLGVKLALVVACGTVLVMAATAAVVQMVTGMEDGDD